MRRVLTIFLMCLLATSCVEWGGNNTDPDGVVIRFSTGELQQTKAGDGNVEDGGGIYVENNVPDLIILIANAKSTGDSAIVMRYPNNGTLVEATATEAAVQFHFGDELEAGDYLVYAFGNTEGLWTMTGPQPMDTARVEYVAADLKNTEKIAYARQLEALQFKPLADNQNPQLIDLEHKRLPVAAKGTLRVSNQKNGEVSLELIRCVAKVTARIINNTGHPLDLYDYKHTVYKICPNTGYVLPHEGNDVIGTAGNLVADPCAINPQFKVEISQAGSKDYDWYVFPSTGPYTIDLQFTVNNSLPAGDRPQYTYKDLRITDWKAVDIPALGRNQHLIVTTRISTGLTVSFNFAVKGWGEPITPNVEFD